MLLNYGVGEILQSPLDCREVKSVNPKWNQSWIFTGRTAAEAKAPVLWPPDGTNWLIGKDSDAGIDLKQEEKGLTEDEMVGWHHQLDGHVFEQATGQGDDQGSLACCSPRVCRVGHGCATKVNWSLISILNHLLSITLPLAEFFLLQDHFSAFPSDPVKHHLATSQINTA